MHEYLFDVKLFAAVRVTAPDLQAARKAMLRSIDCLDLSEVAIDGINSTLGQSVRITEASISQDGEDENMMPAEIDGDCQ